MAVPRVEIVSGGQTGVDRAALDTALALGLPCGGWCPRGRRAEDGPLFTHAFHPVPAKTNVLGAKGCGEAGCAGALPSVMNALIDALSEFGIRHIDMPATPERVWRAIQSAGRNPR